MRILFQGDSITDACRVRGNDSNMGGGYPVLIKSRLGFTEPGKYEFYNRAISGNRVIDIYARIKQDIINLKPDVMSILVGINDVWHELYESPNGIDANKYFRLYSMLIEELLEALPAVKIMILEPFVLKGSATKENWAYFESETKARAEKSREVAEKYNLSFVPLQKGFDDLLLQAPETYWTLDGVHPTEMGQAYIEQEWLKAFYQL